MVSFVSNSFCWVTTWIGSINISIGNIVGGLFGPNVGDHVAARLGSAGVHLALMMIFAMFMFPWFRDAGTVLILLGWVWCFVVPEDWRDKILGFFQAPAEVRNVPLRVGGPAGGRVAPHECINMDELWRLYRAAPQRTFRMRLRTVSGYYVHGHPKGLNLHCTHQTNKGPTSTNSIFTMKFRGDGSVCLKLDHEKDSTSPDDCGRWSLLRSERAPVGSGYYVSMKDTKGYADPSGCTTSGPYLDQWWITQQSCGRHTIMLGRDRDDPKGHLLYASTHSENLFAKIWFMKLAFKPFTPDDNSLFHLELVSL